jgi:hypothetical protein
LRFAQLPALVLKPVRPLRSAPKEASSQSREIPVISSAKRLLQITGRSAYHPTPIGKPTHWYHQTTLGKEMKPTRKFHFDFNPEQFLANEKKAPSERKLPIEECLPISFSKSFKKRLLERLEVDVPGAFYRGSDRTKIDEAMATVRTEVMRELSALNITPDPTLVGFLVAGVICSPLWRRITRNKYA